MALKDKVSRPNSPFFPAPYRRPGLIKKEGSREEFRLPYAFQEIVVKRKESRFARGR